MERMDISNESTNDKIINYLNLKVQEINVQCKVVKQKLANTELQYNDFLQKLQSSEQNCDHSVQITKIWQTIHNNFWIVGVDVRSLLHRPLKNINLILKPGTNKDFTYTTKIYTKYQNETSDELDLLRKNTNPLLEEIVEEIPKIHAISTIRQDEWILTEELKNESTIVALVNLPNFIEFKTINLNGIILYEKSEKNYQLKLPLISLSVDEVISDKYSIKHSDIIQGRDEAYLSIISLAKITQIQVILPEGLYRTLAGIFQIDCNFTKMEIIKNDLLLVYDGKSSNLAYVMVQVDQEKQLVKVITKDEDQLHLLYHHLYQCIPNLILLDETLERIEDSHSLLTLPTQSFLKANTIDQGKLIDLCDSLDRQITFAEDNLKNFCKDQTENIEIEIENDREFRRNLIELEKETDDLFTLIYKS